MKNEALTIYYAGQHYPVTINFASGNRNIEQGRLYARIGDKPFGEQLPNGGVIGRDASYDEESRRVHTWISDSAGMPHRVELPAISAEVPVIEIGDALDQLQALQSWEQNKDWADRLGRALARMHEQRAWETNQNSIKAYGQTLVNFQEGGPAVTPQPGRYTVLRASDNRPGKAGQRYQINSLVPLVSLTSLAEARTLCWYLDALIEAAFVKAGGIDSYRAGAIMEPDMLLLLDNETQQVTTRSSHYEGEGQPLTNYAVAS